MKYCSECGHQNAAHVKFCEACGHAFADAGPAPSAPRSAAPGVPAVARGASEALAAVPRPSSRTIIIAVAAVLVLLVAWFFFLKPASPQAYEAGTEEHLVAMADGWNLVQEGVSGLYGYGYDEEMTAEEYELYKEDIDEGVALIREAAGGLESLRPPGEYDGAHRRLEMFAVYMSDEVAPAVEGLVEDVRPGMTAEQIDPRITRYHEEIARGQDRAMENLERAGQLVYVPSDLNLWGGE